MYEKHHGNSHDELLDFHGYVFRRCNVRAWFDVIARDENLNANQFFLLLCPRIARAYIRVFEQGEEAIRSKHEPRLKPAPTTDEAEDKRRLQLWDDYYLANIDITEPLSKAQRYVEALLQNRWNTEAAHEVASEYYLALKKPLLAAQSLVMLRKLKSSKAATLESNIRALLGTVALDSRVTAAINDALSSK
jgi:N-alpha-acetyltransferase 15/16, NatA auxiliary subunit